jgi:hypothetical protein
MCENSDACKAAGNEKGVPHIEVTPEMIEAGSLELVCFDALECDGADAAKRVFEAMIVKARVSAASS